MLGECGSKYPNKGGHDVNFELIEDVGRRQDVLSQLKALVEYFVVMEKFYDGLHFAKDDNVGEAT